MNDFMKHILGALLIAFLLPAFAQAQSGWEAKPKMHTVHDSLKKESIVLIYDFRKVRYEWSEADKQMYTFKSVQKIVKLQDDKGVESFNTLVLGSRGKMMDIKARTIKKSGKVHELGMKDLKSSTSEYGVLQYHVAFPDVEVGDEIEFFYEERRNADVWGSEQFQFSVPVLHAVFELQHPDHLGFDCKGYNGFPTPDKKIENEQVVMRAEQKYIPAQQEEHYSDPNLYQQRVDYKLSYSEESKGRLYTWNDLAKAMYQRFYNISEKERRAVQKYLTGLNIKSTQKEAEIISKLEAAIKKDIVINEDLSDPAYERLDYLLEKKTTDESGVVKLFATCLDLLNISYELGLTYNRFTVPFDEDMEFWNRLEVYVFYFPQSETIMLPSAAYYRYPFVPPFVEGGTGVFSKRVSLGGATSSVSVLRKFPLTKGKDNWNKIQADISFNPDNFEPNIKYQYTFAGNYAVGLRENLAMVPASDEKELLLNILQIVDEPSQIKDYSFINRGLEVEQYSKPVGFNANLLTPSLVEKAGAKYIFNVGDVIGPQMEMYDDEHRQLPVSIEYPHELYREITINIPKGYKIANPEAVKMNINYGDDLYGFVSTYQLKGDKMIISIREFYASSSYETKQFETFRKVINAAADFNKVSLVFEKI